MSHFFLDIIWLFLECSSYMIWCPAWLSLLLLWKNMSFLYTFVLDSNNQFQQKIIKIMRKTWYMCMSVEFLFPWVAKWLPSASIISPPPQPWDAGLCRSCSLHSHKSHSLCSLSFLLPALNLLPPVCVCGWVCIYLVVFF